MKCLINVYVLNRKSWLVPCIRQKHHLDCANTKTVRKVDFTYADILKLKMGLAGLYSTAPQQKKRFRSC